MPNVEYVNGTKHWYFDDLLHRVDKDEFGLVMPAFIRADGTKGWYQIKMGFYIEMMWK